MIKTRRVLALCCLCALLTGCTSAVPASDVDPTLTLPPASQSHVAPIGDAALEYTADATLYLPGHNGDRLIAFTGAVTFSAARPRAESLTRALLNHSGTDMAASLGGNVRLALYGVNPVEVTSNVATVNLAATALQLSRNKLYMAFQAITNTLTELSDIDYVSFLVMDRAVGMDVANTLPVGVMSRSLGEDINAAYEQKLTRRVTINEDAASKSLSSNVTLYFPLEGTPGILGEVRACAFENQLLEDMVITLLKELAKGSQQREIGSPALPLLSDFLEAPPSVEYSDELGGQVIKLAFSFNLDEMLEAHNISRANSMASLCYTLTSFFPGVAGVSVTIGDVPVETLMLTDSFTSSVLFANQVQQRSDFAPLLYDLSTLYFADSDTQKLVASKRAVPYYQSHHPRFLLRELSRGPQRYDSVKGLTAATPAESIADADILGLALSEDLLLVNFAPSFYSLGQDMTGQQERMLAYSMVNTLCADPRTKSVCFFVSGAQPQGFTGEIYWEGVFYPLF